MIDCYEQDMLLNVIAADLESRGQPCKLFTGYNGELVYQVSTPENNIGKRANIHITADWRVRIFTFHNSRDWNLSTDIYIPLADPNAFDKVYYVVMNRHSN